MKTYSLRWLKHSKNFDSFHSEFWKRNNERYRKAKIAAGLDKMEKEDVFYSTYIKENKEDFRKYFIKSLWYTMQDIKESFLWQIATLKEKIIKKYQ